MELAVRNLKLGQWCRLDSDGDPIEPGTRVTVVNAVDPKFRTVAGVDEVMVDLVVGQARTTVAL